MNFSTIILALIILIFSFTEIIVFNEEVLLALCFVAFVFFAYSKLNDSISMFFKDNALKLENDLLFSLILKSEKIVSQFEQYYFSQKLQNSNSLLETIALFSVSNFINTFFSNFIDNSLTKVTNTFKDIQLFNENLSVTSKKKKLKYLNSYIVPFVIQREYNFMLQRFLPLAITK